MLWIIIRVMWNRQFPSAVCFVCYAKSAPQHGTLRVLESESYASSGTVLQGWAFVVPGGNKARAGMDIDLAKCPGTGIDKLVRDAGWGNHDLAGNGFNRFV